MKDEKHELQTVAQSPMLAVLSNPEQLKDLPVEKIRELWEINKEMQERDARIAFETAFHALQTEMDPVRKAAKNTQTHSLYAKAEAIDAMLNPLLDRHGFTCSSWMEESPQGNEDDTLTVLRLTHASGHSERYTMPAAIDYKGLKGTQNKTRVQGVAAAQTFVVRHLKCNVFNVRLVDDNDGNSIAGTETISPQQAASLNQMIQETGARKQAFLDVYGVADLKDLPAINYTAAVRALEAKRARK